MRTMSPPIVTPERAATAAAGPSGTAGKPGPPLFLSPAHYCGVDEAVAQGVEGLACDSERHELFMDVGACLCGGRAWAHPGTAWHEGESMACW